MRFLITFTFSSVPELLFNGVLIRLIVSPTFIQVLICVLGRLCGETKKRCGHYREQHSQRTRQKD